MGPLFLSGFNETSIFWTRFPEIHKYQFPCKYTKETSCSMQTSGRTNRETLWGQTSLLAILRTRLKIVPDKRVQLHLPSILITSSQDPPYSYTAPLFRLLSAKSTNILYLRNFMLSQSIAEDWIIVGWCTMLNVKYLPTFRMKVVPSYSE